MSFRAFRASEDGAANFSHIGLPVGLIGLFAVLMTGVLDPVPSGPGPETVASIDQSAEARPESGQPLRAVQQTYAAPVRVRSDFAGALNGWTFGRGEAVSQLEHRLGPGSDGMQGFLRFRDGDGGQAAYLRMPSAHLGDQSRLYGGTIRLALRIVAGGAWIGDGSPLIRFTDGRGRVLAFHSATEPARTGWTELVIDVSAVGWELDGRPATEDAMRSVLADVALGEVRIEQLHGSDEVIDLDTVEFIGDYRMPGAR